MKVRMLPGVLIVAGSLAVVTVTTPVLVSAAGAGLRCIGVTTSYAAGELTDAEMVVDGLHSLTVSALDDLVAGRSGQ